MRNALSKPKRGGSATVRTVPPPIGGWNARDPLSGMGKADAVTLDNWVVTPGGIRVRPGRTTWATGLGGPIESVMDWQPAGGNAKLFAAVPSAIYDVTAQAAVGAAAVSGLGNGRWQHLNFATPGGNYLIAVNGQNGVRSYNGTTWATQAITGSGGGFALNATDLIGVTAHMNRLWFIERSSCRIWYLPVQSIAGAASLFDISSLCDLGGEVLAMATWTRDGGSGPDDYGVFVTSAGQVLVYAGTDPQANTTWALAGRYKIPRPIGRRCVLKVGAELVVLTVQGPVPLSQVLAQSEAGARNTAITDKISGAFDQAADLSASVFGWQMIEHPGANLLVVNVPARERVAQVQFVLGTRTKAWSSFSGIDVGAWGGLGTDLFGGGNNGTVYKLDRTSDDGQPILATYQHAYLDFGTPQTKRCTLARPRIVAPPGYVPAVHIRADFDTSTIPFRILAAMDTGPAWDETSWDTAYWGAESVSTQQWQGVLGYGSTLSPAFRIGATAPVMLNGVDLTYELGGLF